MGKKKLAVELRSQSLKCWRCKECGHVQDDNMNCAKCGQFSKGFDEVQKKIPAEAPSKDYVVFENISYDGKLIEKGMIINLADTDPCVNSLLKRKLVGVMVYKEEGKKKE